MRFKRLIWLHIFFGTSWCNPPRNEMIYTKIIQKKRIIKIHNRGLSQKKIPKKGLIPDKKSTIPDTFKISSVEYAHFLHVFFRVFDTLRSLFRAKKTCKKWAYSTELILKVSGIVLFLSGIRPFFGTFFLRKPSNREKDRSGHFSHFVKELILWSPERL